MSSTLRASVTVGQSRPTQSRETKNFGSLLRKLKLKRGPQNANINSTSENSNMTTLSMMTTSSASLHHQTSFLRSHRHRQVLQNGPSMSMDLMEWLKTDCPQDLIPRVLAYAGPQTATVLSQTCRFWKDVLDKESTWRTLCEELYKVG